MRAFDYSFLENGMLPAGLVNSISAISRLRERLDTQKLLNTEAFKSPERTAKVQSVISSNAIEGIVANEFRLHEIVTYNAEPLNR